MHSLDLVWLVLLGEGLLAAIALSWIYWREVSLTFGHPLLGFFVGVIVAAVMAAVNYYLICHAPSFPGLGSLRRFYVSGLTPMFRDVSVVQMIVISSAAGIGEELLFRGVIQSELGLVPASVIFGLMHIGGVGTLAFGVWAMVMGGLLGAVAVGTGGLFAPILAHSLYDAVAIGYIRWGSNSGELAADEL